MVRPAFVWTMLLVCGSSGIPEAVFAQTPTTDLVTPPGNVLLANSRVPVGPNAGLEGGAYVARVGDPSAAWMNPAGLSRALTSELSGSSGLFQVATVSPSSLPDTGGAVQQLPALVGFTAANVLRKDLTLGLSVLTSSSWEQQTDSQLVVDRGTARERFAYSADSDYEEHVGAAGVGFASGRLRMGGSLAFVYTSIRKNEVVSDRLASTTNLRSVLLDSRLSGSAFQLRPQFGVQYDVSPHVLMGGLARTPALTVYSTGSYTADGIAENGSSSLGTSVFDAAADFTNRLPFEFQGGLAYVGARGELEVDVQAYTPISQHQMLATDQPIVTYTNPGGGAAPIVTTRTSNGWLSQSRGLANVSFGGHFMLTSSGVWRLHFGAGTDNSPVGAADQVFTNVNLYRWSAGVSGTKGKFQFTAGVNYRGGSSDDVIVRDLQNGDLIKSGINIRTIGLIYSLSYKF